MVPNLDSKSGSKKADVASKTKEYNFSILTTDVKGTVQRDGSSQKLGSFENSLLKREARGFLEKSARPPFCESPLKLQHHLVKLLAIGILIANSAHSSICGLLFTTYSCWRQRYE